MYCRNIVWGAGQFLEKKIRRRLSDILEPTKFLNCYYYEFESNDKSLNINKTIPSGAPVLCFFYYQYTRINFDEIVFLPFQRNYYFLDVFLKRVWKLFRKPKVKPGDIFYRKMDTPVWLSPALLLDIARVVYTEKI